MVNERNSLTLSSTYPHLIKFISFFRFHGALGLQTPLEHSRNIQWRSYSMQHTQKFDLICSKLFAIVPSSYFIHISKIGHCNDIKFCDSICSIYSSSTAFFFDQVIQLQYAYLHWGILIGWLKFRISRSGNQINCVTRVVRIKPFANCEAGNVWGRNFCLTQAADRPIGWTYWKKLNQVCVKNMWSLLQTLQEELPSVQSYKYHNIVLKQILFSRNHIIPTPTTNYLTKNHLIG